MVECLDRGRAPRVGLRRIVAIDAAVNRAAIASRGGSIASPATAPDTVLAIEADTALVSHAAIPTVVVT